MIFNLLSFLFKNKIKPNTCLNLNLKTSTKHTMWHSQKYNFQKHEKQTLTLSIELIHQTNLQTFPPPTLYLSISSNKTFQKKVTPNTNKEIKATSEQVWSFPLHFQRTHTSWWLMRERERESCREKKKTRNFTINSEWVSLEGKKQVSMVPGAQFICCYSYSKARNHH